jgi:hypothetical protein
VRLSFVTLALDEDAIAPSSEVDGPRRAQHASSFEAR